MKQNQRLSKLQRYGLLGILGGLLLMAAARETAPNVGVIDPDRIRRESASVSAEMEKLSAPARELLNEVQAKQAALSKGLEDLNRQRSALSAETLRQRSEALQKQSEEVQALSKRLKERLDKAGSEGLSPMRQRVGQAVAEVARQKGVKLVLSSTSVIYNTEDLDLTGEVIARLDGAAKKKD